MPWILFVTLSDRSGVRQDGNQYRAMLARGDEHRGKGKEEEETLRKRDGGGGDNLIGNSSNRAWS